MLEDAIPIDVSRGQTMSAREVFSIAPKEMREKAELTKEERRKERASRKRKIKQSMKAKSNFKKEKLREDGLALAERFAVRETKR